MVDHVVTLFERQTISYQSLGMEPNDPFFESLDHLNNKSGKEIVQLERTGLRATQFVGVVQAGKHTIQILPKIDCDPDASAEAVIGSRSYERAVDSAAKNFLYLLTHTRKIKLHSQSLASLATNRGAWFELLIRLFTIELFTQLQQGIHQDYVLKDDLLMYIRGRWNIGRQFSRRPNLAQGLDVSYEDYLPDILLNRVFLEAVDRLEGVTHDPQNRQMLVGLRNWLQPVQLPMALNREDLDQVKFNRLNERFYPAFQLARLLLEGLTVQLLAGGQRATALVFDMDRLFQEFVASLLKSNSRLILPESWQDLPIELQGSVTKRHLVQPPNPSEKPLFPLSPDILLGGLDWPAVIIDTKNKALPIRKPYRAVSETDAYQMLAYATALQCPTVLLLYPKTLGSEDCMLQPLAINQTSVRLFVATINLHQPLSRIFPLIQDLRNIFHTLYQHTGSPLEVAWPG